MLSIAAGRSKLLPIESGVSPLEIHAASVVLLILGSIDFVRSTCLTEMLQVAGRGCCSDIIEYIAVKCPNNTMRRSVEVCKRGQPHLLLIQISWVSEVELAE